MKIVSMRIRNNKSNENALDFSALHRLQTGM